MTTSTKLKIFNSHVKAVLLYGLDCWKLRKELTRKLGVFKHRCLRSVSKIKWSKVVSNNKPRETVEQEHISVENAKKWRWSGQISEQNKK